jgi:aminoglycoside phosphotransferase (APT) family kinase protein
MHGAINDVFKIRAGLDTFCIRVRTRESLFRYENGLIKEPVMAMLLRLPGHLSCRDREAALDEIVAAALTNSIGCPIGGRLLPGIVYYDHSRTSVPFVWSCSEWVEGPPIDFGEAGDCYCKLGASVALLHSVRFERARDSLFSPWVSPADWLSKTLRSIERISQARAIDIDLTAYEKIDATRLTFVMTHNDLHPLNLIRAAGEPVLIDWDNAQVAPCELDLVKLMYWTARDATGCFTARSDLFGAFISGYRNLAATKIDQEVLKLCQLLWLCRVLDFEVTREREGYSPQPPFRAAMYYRQTIAALQLGQHRWSPL